MSGIISQLIDETLKLVHHRRFLLIEVDSNLFLDSPMEERAFKVIDKFDTREAAIKHYRKMYLDKYVTNDYPQIDLTGVEIEKIIVYKDGVSIQSEKYSIIKCRKGEKPVKDHDSLLPYVEYNYDDLIARIECKDDPVYEDLSVDIVTEEVINSVLYKNHTLLYYNVMELKFNFLKTIEAGKDWIDIPMVLSNISYWHLIKMHKIDEDEARGSVAVFRNMGGSHNQVENAEMPHSSSASRLELMEMIRNDINNLKFMENIRKLSEEDFENTEKITVNDKFFGGYKRYTITKTDGGKIEHEIQERTIWGYFKISFQMNVVKIKHVYSVWDNAHSYIDHYEYRLFM